MDRFQQGARLGGQLLQELQLGQSVKVGKVGKESGLSLSILTLQPQPTGAHGNKREQRQWGKVVQKPGQHCRWEVRT